MIKRPLGLGCFLITALLFALTVCFPAPYKDYGSFQGKRLAITGEVYKKETSVIKEEPVSVLYLKRSRRAQMAEDGAGPEWERVICYLKDGQKEPEMGSLVSLEGRLTAFERASNPGQFDTYSYYQISKVSYRLNQAIILSKSTNYSYIGEACHRLKIYFAEKLKEALPEEAFSVMQAMLLGMKGSMEQELKALYQRNGIAHVLAISGLHVSMLGMGLYHLLRKCGVPMKVAAVISSLFMFLFGMMTGFSVSAFRAVIMFAIQMAGIFLERTYDMLTALAVAAVLALFEQPLYLYHSGFVFSFGCVLGIGMVQPVLMEGKALEYWGIKVLAGGVGMMIITLPVYLWFYYQFPVYSVFLNLLVIPLMSFLMAAGVLLIFCQIMCPVFSPLFCFFIQGALKIYERTCEFCDVLPGGKLTPGKPQAWQVMAYVAILLMVVLLKKKIKPLLRWCTAGVAMMLLILHPRGALSLTFLDVGQGDCIYIENENGNCYLVDGGSSSVSDVGKYRIIPFLKVQGASRIEAVFVTHPDEDHCNGIEKLLDTGRREGITIKNLVLPDVEEGLKNDAYKRLERMAAQSGIPVSYIKRGQKIMNGKMTLICLNPSFDVHYGGTNEYSVVLKLTYGAFSALLTGDVEGMGERAVIQYIKENDWGQITVLKAAHHGSGGSTPNEFLDSQNPVCTIISCGRNNSYGHPHMDLVERLESHDSNIFITYETGAVTFTTNGRKVRLLKFSGE